MYQTTLRILFFLSPLLAACDGSNWAARAKALRLGTCATCSVEIEQVWSSLPKDPNVNDAGLIELDSVVLAVSGLSGNRITRFDRRTSKSEQLDRSGEGPGEFSLITAGFLDPSGDTLILTDTGGRISFLTKDLEFVRSFNAPVRPSNLKFIGLADGGFVALYPIPLRNSTGRFNTLHLFSREGDLLRSWEPTEDPLGVASKSRVSSAGRAGRFWLLVSGDLGFTATLEDARTGEALRTITVQPPWWFSSGKSAMEMEQDDARRRKGRAPPDTHATFAVERDGVLWVVISHFDPRWETADPSVYDPELLRDYVFVAIDIGSGVPLASVAFDEDVVLSLTGRHLVTYQLEGVGYPRFRMYDFRLVRDAE